MTIQLLQRFKSALLLMALCIVGNVVQAQTYSFTTAGATGISGPTQTQVSTAYAATTLAGNVTVTAGIQSWTVPVAGLYKIEVYGANGYGSFSGRGAYMSGEFNFNASDVLHLLVGQQGGCCVGSGTNQYGGGGGTFVVDASSTPLIVAGGGGGAIGFTSIPSNSDASITTSGNAGVGSAGGAGGTNGSGGGDAGIAGGGGGFSGDGGISPYGGLAFLNGGQGGTAASSGSWGGFGGGGGANSYNNNRGGGGGGYSGGGGAGSSASVAQAGGGGGSYNSGSNQVNTAALGTGDGLVIITLLAPAVSVPNNTGATAFPSLAAGICPGSQSVDVKIRNFGDNYIDSVKIAWEVNGVLQSDNWYTVNLDTFPVANYETTVTLGTYNFLQGASTVRAWTSLPNSQTDTVTNNDTVAITITPRLGGTFTVNSSQTTGGTNYQSFTDLANDLNNYGVCSPLVVNVAPGSGPYNEQITFSQISGASATNTIMINGNGDTLTSTGTTLNLDGADYITVNNLVINATASLGFAVHLMNDADNNTFDSCTFLADPTSTSSASGCVSMSNSPTSYSSAGSNGSNNLFNNCTTDGGYFGFAFYGSAGGNTSNNITNCTIRNYYVYGAYNVQQTSGVISHSLFERPTRTPVSTGYAAAFSTGCTNMLAEGNTVRNFFGSTPTSTSTVYAFYCTVDGTSGNENKFINNLVYDLGGNGTHYGLYLSGADYVQAYHNTISLDNVSSTAGTTYGIYSTGTVGGIDIRNNNISVTRGGTGTKYCLYFSGGQQISDNNNLYMGSTSGTNYVGYYSSGYPTLTAWQGANGSIWDQNSKTADPQFVSPATGDFTPGTFQLDNTGAAVGVTTDITGAARNVTTPDIGAYEFSVPLCNGSPVAGTAASSDPSACAGGSVTLTLAGYTIGNGITIQWEESPAFAGVWTPISGATTATYAPTINSATDYHAIVTCTNGGATDISNTVTVNISPFYLCYCSPLTGTTLHGTTGNYITNVIIQNTTLSNPTSAVGAGGYTQADPSIPSNTATLTQGQTYTLDASITSASYTAEMWIDWDQNGVFDSSEYTLLPSATTASTNITVPVSATPGMTGMRLRVAASSTTHYNDTGACANISIGRETEDYVITVNAASPCSGTPGTTGTITSNNLVICNGGTVDMTLTGYPLELGITYNWESSPSGQSNFVPISGATDLTYTSGALSANTDFRVAVTCNNPGGGTAYTTPVTAVVNNPQITSTTGATRCGVGSVTLSAATGAGNSIKWYAAAAGGAPLDTGVSFITPSIATTTTYNAEAVAAGGGSDTVAVPLAHGNTTGSYYHMFLVQATNNITINTLGIKCSNTAGTLTAWDVYYRTDNYQTVAGANTSSTGWILLASVTNVPSVGATDYTTIASGLNVSIPAGATYSFHIAPASGTTHTYATDAIGTTVASNADAALIAGNRGSSAFNCGTSGGMATVSLGYTTGCAGTRVPVAATVTTPPAYALGATPDTVCAGSSSTISISSANAYTYTWTPTGTGSSFSATPATTTTYYVNGIDGNNCTISDSVTVNVKSVPATVNTVAQQTAVCVSGNAELSLSPVPMSGIGIQWQRNTGSGYIDMPGATADTLSDPVTANVSYQANFFCGGTLIGTSVPVAITYSNPSVVNTVPGTRCDAGPVTLLAEGGSGATINWYAAATGGVPLGSGNAFTTPSITTSTTYYASAVSGGSGLIAGGKPAPASTATGYSAGTLHYGLVFDALQPFTLVSVDVYSSAGAGSLTLALEDNTGTVIQTMGPFSIPAGTGSTIANGATPTTIPLNISIPTGTGYRLYTSNLTATFIRENSGNTYPYPLGTVGNVTTSWTSGSASATNYYFLYNWKVSTGCESSRVPVAATISGTTSPNGISTGGTTIVGTQADGTTVNYTDGCNDLVLTITDASGGNVLGSTVATVVTLPSVQTASNDPFVPRVFDITPASDGPGTVTLYVLQSEFDAYNNYVTNNSLSLPLLPTGPTDATGMNNIVITQYHGLASAGSYGPLGLYANTNVDLIQNSSITKSSNGTYWTLTFPVTGFSGFFIHTGNAPLSIDLMSIAATNMGHRNRVNWSTASEKDGDYFHLERSADGRNYSLLATIKAKGERSDYTYWDENPVNGINYYRLKMYDAAGSYKYSKVVSATVKGAGDFTVEAYPNPVSNSNLTIVAYGTNDKEATVTITDVTGKLIKTVTMIDGMVEVDMKALAQGIYLVKYADAHHTETIKVNKQ
jgi:hypothetical protein